MIIYGQAHDVAAISRLVKISVDLACKLYTSRIFWINDVEKKELLKWAEEIAPNLNEPFKVDIDVNWLNELLKQAKADHNLLKLVDVKK